MSLPAPVQTESRMMLSREEIIEGDARALYSDIVREWGEADGSILDDRRGALPDFPLHTLPRPVAESVSRAAHAAGVTAGHVALPLISIASALIGAARQVKPSRGWSEPMAVWGAIVGASGTGKTPGIGAIKSALAHIERNRKEKVSELERLHETKAETAKAAHKKWLKEVEDATAKKQPPPRMPPEAVKVGPFIGERLYATDATIERLAVLLQARPSGLLLAVDELAGLFANMSRYSNGSDREFWLEAWNGKPHAVERMGRAPVMLDHLLVGIIGGLQPDKLTAAFDGDADGMYARFCFAWPQEPGYRPLSNEACEVEPDLVNALTKLARLAENDDDVFAPKPVCLSSDAVAAFEAFRQFLHNGKDSLDGREREWWSKGATQVLRIAGTLTFLCWAWGSTREEPREVDAATIEAAITLWRDYFWPHSRAVLRQIGLTQHHTKARRALKWIAANRKEEVSVKNIRRDALAHALDAKQTEALLDGLAQLNWLRKQTSETGGRPTHRWAVNPLLFHSQKAGTAQVRLSDFPAAIGAEQ